MRILLLTRYDQLGASSRIRSLQYLKYLRKNGHEIKVCPLFSNEYLAAMYEKRSRVQYLITGYLRRFVDVARAKSYDLVWLEKELLPFFPAFGERLLNVIGTPYIVDYDDALFHRYDKNRWAIVRMLLGNKIDAVMRGAKLVIAGNGYIANRAKLAGAQRIEIVPTVVDLLRYPKKRPQSNQTVTVGWIGTPKTTHYLSFLGPIFRTLADIYNHRVKFVAIGANSEEVSGYPIEVLPWSEASEVDLLETLDVGVMPLDDSPWERGKCGYKLIQYMAVRLPVIASPVGVNTSIVEHGVTGFLASSGSEWEASLKILIEDSTLRNEMGGRGRCRVEDWYSLQVQASRLGAFLRSVV